MKTLVALALMMLLGLPIVAHAQDAYTPIEKWRLSEVQLVKSLQSPVDNVRTQSLKNAIIFATLYRDKLDLGQAVDAIRDVYEDDDEHASNRKLALAALQAIGGPRASSFVARRATLAETDESRILMVTVLNGYYQAKTDVTASLR
ncbi:MAG: hypothetical protein ACE5G0_02570 [Rhodothermales bacterium]